LLLALLLFTSRAARAPSHSPLSVLPAHDATAAEPLPVDAASPNFTPTDIAPPELVATADELQAQYESLKAKLPEETSKPLDDDIGVVEGAVTDLLAAIAAEPDNESLKRMLIATYRNEVRILKKALHLSGSTEEEEEVVE
jgi:hypothetical protein